MLYKLRTIVGSNSREGARNVQGLTIPAEVALFFEGCHFKIEKSGTCIIAHSGASVNHTSTEINRYRFEDIKL